MPLVTNNNVINLVNSLELLPDVIQARTSYAVKDSTIAKYGQDCVLVCIFYPTVDFRSDKNNCNKPRQHQVVVSKNIYDNSNCHISVVETSNTQVQTYYANTASPQLKLGVDLVANNIVYSAVL